jgi:hypothetical protein
MLQLKIRDMFVKHGFQFLKNSEAVSVSGDFRRSSDLII